jgi:hypothetical protein
VDTAETPMHAGASRVVYNLDLLTPVGTAETVMHGGDTTVKSAAVKTTGVEPAAVEPATVPSASVPSTATRVGEIWLAEDSRTQHRSCNAQHGPGLLGGGFVIA